MPARSARLRLAPAVTLAVAALALAVAVAAPSVARAADEVPLEEVGRIAALVRWGGVLTSILLFFVTWLALRFVGRFVDRLGHQFAGQRLLLGKIFTLVRFAVYAGVATAAVFLSLHLDDRAIAILGGTLAVSVGFAIKDLVSSLVAGVMIMVDRPFQVGDRVSFGGEYGDITAIGLRSVRLVTLDDNTVTIPNNKFLNDITSCGNYGALDMQVVMDFHVALDADVALARDVVLEAGLSSRYVHLPKPVVVLVKQVMTEQLVAVQLRLKAYVLDTRYEKAFETDVNLRVLEAFRALGVGPPAMLHRALPPAPASGPVLVAR